MSPPPKRPSLRQIRGTQGSLMLPSSYSPHFVVMHLLMYLSVCPLNWVLPKNRAHLYFILHGHLEPSTMPDTKEAQ